MLDLANSHIPRKWKSLFSHALALIDEIDRYGMKDPFWTFGGGTVLMLRYAHRYSKDIDIFVPDPQSLGYVTPRLSRVAESITNDYTEADSYVKLYLEDGEIDFVAAPNLTIPGFVWETLFDRQVRVETSAEIIAKKMWHRGDQITGRDIFDFALINEREPESIRENSRFMTRHAEKIFLQLSGRRSSLATQFNAVETLTFKPSFDEACIAMLNALDEMKKTG